MMIALVTLLYIEDMVLTITASPMNTIIGHMKEHLKQYASTRQSSKLGGMRQGLQEWVVWFLNAIRLFDLSSRFVAV